MRLSSILQTPASLLCDAMTGDLDAFSGADNKNQVVTCFARSLDIRQKSSRAGPDLTGVWEGLENQGHCVYKWILRGHFKPTPSATI